MHRAMDMAPAVVGPVAQSVDMGPHALARRLWVHPQQRVDTGDGTTGNTEIVACFSLFFGIVRSLPTALWSCTAACAWPSGSTSWSDGMRHKRRTVWTMADEGTGGAPCSTLGGGGGSQTTPATTSTSSIHQLLGAADAQTAHPATSSTVPTHQRLGSANAETTPARTTAAVADRKQRPDATCEGKNG